MTLPATDPDPLSRLLAHEEIRQLAYRYAYACDFRDVDLFRSLWAESTQATTDADIDARRAEELITEWPNRGPSILMVCNHLIDLDDDDHAHGAVYCIVQAGWGDRFIDQSILYQDRYVRDSGHWKFAVRRHLMWFGKERSTHPFHQPAANWPERPVGRGTLPDDIESYRKFYTDPSNERPDSTTKELGSPC